jgi:hypothetical protein
MIMQDYIDALMELKRKGQLSGRDASSKDIAALTSGYFSDAAQRDIQERTLALKEKALAQQGAQSASELALKKSTFDDSMALQRWQQTNMMGAADTASRNEMFGNILKGLVNIGGMYYLNGRRVM